MTNYYRAYYYFISFAPQITNKTPQYIIFNKLSELFHFKVISYGSVLTSLEKNV